MAQTDAGSLEFMEYVLRADYHVHLVVVHVPADTARRRATMRASRSGRLSCGLFQQGTNVLFLILHSFFLDIM